MNLATQDDVEARLGRELTTAEIARLPGLLEEASAIVEGYLGVVYTTDDTVPPQVAIVVSRMVSRALTTSIPDGVKSEAAGPYQRSYSDGASSLWLSKYDKLALRNVSGGVVSVPLRSERGYICDAS